MIERPGDDEATFICILEKMLCGELGAAIGIVGRRRIILAQRRAVEGPRLRLDGRDEDEARNAGPVGRPREVERLIEIGMRFDRDASGALSLTREGGHGRRRIVHTDGDATGRELSRALVAACRQDPRVRLFEKCFVLDLVTSGGARRGDDRVLGAITHHPKYGLQIIWARTTIVATGGMGQLWRETTNSRIATGDGVAMAWRAGAQVADLEFEQFHPTALYVAGAARSLISEAVRGEGAYLVDRSGRRFMEGRHPLGELAPRDVVSRGIVEHLAATAAAIGRLDDRLGIDLGEPFHTDVDGRGIPRGGGRTSM
jgi:L-aspartate oxidase